MNLWVLVDGRAQTPSGCFRVFGQFYAPVFCSWEMHHELRCSCLRRALDCSADFSSIRVKFIEQIPHDLLATACMCSL